MKYSKVLLVGSLALSALALGGCAGTGASAQASAFKLSSPDLASGTFATQYILNGFGCTGGNVSPALTWSGVPAGTKSLALQIHDPDAPTGSGFWHWAVYDISPSTTGLTRGAGNNAASLPSGAYGGQSDFLGACRAFPPTPSVQQPGQLQQFKQTRTA